jgi:hypothetical protein
MTAVVAAALVPTARPTPNERDERVILRHRLGMARQDV